MATARLEFGQEAAIGSDRPWWRRRDPYLLTVVCGIHVVIVGHAVRGIGSQWWPVADNALLGVIFAECFLLAMWGALGGLGTVPRWCAVIAVFACGLGSVAARQQHLSLEELWTEALTIGLMGATIVTALAGVMVPLRGLAGWRIDFSAEHYREIRSRRGQLGILDFAALSCAVAAPLAAARLVNESGAWSAEDWPLFVSIGTLVMVTAAPIAYSVVACRRVWLIAFTAMAWPLLMGAVHSWLGCWYDELLFSGGAPWFAGLYLEMGAFHAGIGLAVVLTLAPLRLFGLHLLVVGPSSREAHQIAITDRGFGAALKPRKAA